MISSTDDLISILIDSLYRFSIKYRSGIQKIDSFSIFFNFFNHESLYRESVGKIYPYLLNLSVSALLVKLSFIDFSVYLEKSIPRFFDKSKLCSLILPYSFLYHITIQWFYPSFQNHPKRIRIFKLIIILHYRH